MKRIWLIPIARRMSQYMGSSSKNWLSFFLNCLDNCKKNLYKFTLPSPLNWWVFQVNLYTINKFFHQKSWFWLKGFFQKWNLGKRIVIKKLLQNFFCICDFQVSAIIAWVGVFPAMNSSSNVKLRSQFLCFNSITLKPKSHSLFSHV